MRTFPTETCEGCQERLLMHQVNYDAEGVPLCGECWRSLLAESRHLRVVPQDHDVSGRSTEAPGIGDRSEP